MHLIGNTLEVQCAAVQCEPLVNEKADKSHDCDEHTEGGEEIEAGDLVDTCEEQGGHNHPGLANTQHSGLTCQLADPRVRCEASETCNDNEETLLRGG